MLQLPLAFYFIIIILVIHYIKQRLTPARASQTSTMLRVINRRGGRVVPAARGGRRILPRIPMLDDEKSTQAEHSSSTSSNTTENQQFDADIDDVFAVKDILKQAGSLPDEIAIMILDNAEYWACSSATVDYTNLQRRAFVISAGPNEDQFLVRSEPIGMTTWSTDDDHAWRSQAPNPQQFREHVSREKLHKYVDDRIEAVLEHPCRKIVFKINSRDQGWGGNPVHRGTYNGSSTWFDAGLERFDATAVNGSDDIHVDALKTVWPSVIAEEGQPGTYLHELNPAPDHMIQCNRTATSEFKEHVVEWRYTDDVDPEISASDELVAAGRGRATGNGQAVRDMRLGDVITVWGRARYGGWQNHIGKVEIKVYWKAI